MRIPSFCMQRAKQLANQKKCATMRLGYGTIMMQLPFLVESATAVCGH